MQHNIAIVVAAYNRPVSLQRLLQSLSAADYSGYSDIQLIISVDYSGTDACTQQAEAFVWSNGEKTVVQHPQNLGLKKHILFCGAFTENFDAVIVLEDDLFVSPFFYNYAQQAYAFYKTDDRIAGIALYHNTFNEVAYCPFEPLHDGFDMYLMQIPCSWGQLWTKEQWASFIAYNHTVKDDMFALLPATVQAWPSSTSWKKIFYSYLMQTGKYFVYPRIGLSTNFGDAGQHLTSDQTAFQTPLLLAAKVFQFSSPDNSLSIYDGYFELDGKLYQKLVDAEKEVSFDLNGTKPLSAVPTRYLISSKKCSKPLQQFAVACYPYENNVLLAIQKQATDEVYFSLGETAAFSNGQQFSRLPIDLKRVFLTDDFLRTAVRGEIEQSKEFQIGSKIFKPFRFVRNIFRK